MDMTRNRKTVFWHIPVTETLDRAVEEAVYQDMHSTKTELVREAVREKLKEMGVSWTVASTLKEVKVTSKIPAPDLEG
jgi:Arc/MetJ-type ribon-helix-helix transcriptional regulator